MEDVKVGEKDGKETRREKQEDYEKTREDLDVDQLLDDFAQFMSEKGKHKTRMGKFIDTLLHMTIAVATQGLYIPLYLGWYVFKFYTKIELSDYKQTIYVKQSDVE